MLPVCAPALVGEKTTVAVQLAGEDSVAGQALLATLKAPAAASFRLVRLAAPLGFVRVTVTGPLVHPTPVIGKVTIPGCACSVPGTPPIPLKVTLAATPSDGALTVSAPLKLPLTAGEKTTPVEQLEPALRTPVHVFCARLKGGGMARFTALRSPPPVLVIKTPCTALIWPGRTIGKLNCAGLTVSAPGAVPVPLRGTWTAATPVVEEETTSVAAFPPAPPE